MGTTLTPSSTVGWVEMVVAAAARCGGAAVATNPAISEKLGINLALPCFTNQ